MIPPLDEHGLLPQGVFPATLEEIETVFAWNAHRKTLMEGLRDFLVREWCPLGLTCPVLVDGSFVRAKPLPSDIDVVIDLTHLEDIPSLALALTLRLRHDELKKAYAVDVWPRHPSLPHDLAAFFQYLGEKGAAELRLPSHYPKGILRIEP
jgi:hypothetical protein